MGPHTPSPSTSSRKLRLDRDSGSTPEGGHAELRGGAREESHLLRDSVRDTQLAFASPDAARETPHPKTTVSPEKNATISKAEVQPPRKQQDSIRSPTVLARVVIAYCNFMSPSATVFASARSGPSGPEPLIGRSTEHQRGFGAVLVPMSVQPGASGLQYVPGGPTG